ncbi:sensor histidine kinase [Sphingomonas sp. S2-65]|uniref:sensor histidine kinase n=1 Tax=Sphingomonas sp. S2-65 TaxID=2903960 RepID=UPI001F368ED9|nr:sensor histidine kinase [Sphingomonas sp. S2-65]UYY57514.1 sensor histidine kinase [Sphingomonas sp. S2-65]
MNLYRSDSMSPERTAGDLATRPDGDLRAALAAAQEREMLLRGELQHRVRNMLAVVRSIFARTVAAGGNLDDVANHFQGRLDVLARYQAAAVTGTHRTVDFETMIHDELQSVQAAGDPRVTFAGPEVGVPPDTALLIGLALHELVTNSIKFGTLSLPPERGTLAIGWTIEGDHLDIDWDERGMPVLGAAPQRHGFGRTFIEQALPYQLGAQTRYQIGPGTISCSIRVPLARGTASDGEAQ